MQKKLLVISSLYPSTKNPVRGIFVKEQVALLTKIYDVKVIAIEFPVKLSYRQELFEDVPIFYITFPIIKKFFPSSIIMFFIFAFLPVLRVVRSWKPDFIHLHDYKHFPEAFCLKYLLDCLTIPKFLTLHNIKSKPGLLNSKYTNWIYAITQNKAYENWNCIFTVNQRLADYVANYNQNTLVIGNGLRANEYDEDCETGKLHLKIEGSFFNIISVGNLVKTKGFDLLIRAVSIINKDNDSIKLYIFGSGCEEKALRTLIKSEGQEHNIYLKGCIENTILRNLYHRFDAFVLPSWSETFGIVYLEAMYSGLAVIGVENQGLWGLFKDEEEALFVKAHDIDDLIIKINRLKTDEEYRIRIAQNAQEKVKKEYMLDQLVSRIIKRYEDE